MEEQTNRQRKVAFPTPSLRAQDCESVASLVANDPQSHNRGTKSNKQHKVAFTLAEGATHVAMPNWQRLVAFTLAEVLITLGIIGIVAAMTLPTLIANHKKQVTIEKLKKAYSSISQAVERSKVDNGDIREWNWDLSSIDFFNKYFIPYLQTVKTCTIGDNGCWTKDGSTYALNGSVVDFLIPLACPAIVFSDGTWMFFINQHEHAHIIIDLNGEKKPNTYAKDVFVLTFTKGPVYTEDDWGIVNVNSAGVYFFGHGYSRVKLTENCRINGDGRYCGQLIMFDGWKMSKDYPGI